MYQEDCAHNIIQIKTVSDKNTKGNAGRKYEVCNGCKKFLRFRPSDESAPGWDDYQPPEWDDNHAPGWDDYWEGGNDFTSSETHEPGPLRLSDLNTNNMDAAPSAQTVHHEALTKIINQFTATHVFIQHGDALHCPTAPSYPKKIYISSSCSYSPPKQAELANLVYFNGHFYAKTPNGCPIEGIQYILRDIHCLKSHERPNVNEAIVALANAILNT